MSAAQGMTPASAQQLALWIAINHPIVFTELQRRAMTQRGRRSSFAGFGDDGSVIDTSQLDTSQLDTITVTADAPAPDFGTGADTATLPDFTDLTVSAPDQSAFIQPVDSTLNIAAPPPVSVNPGDATGGTSLLSSLGSGVANAVAGVGQFLTSNQGLSSLAGLATAYFNSQAQSSVLATQVARAQAGQSPAPVTYVPNARGQLTPVMVNPQTGAVAIGPNGQPYPVTPQTLSALGPSATLSTALSSFISQYWWLLLAGVGIFVVLA